MKYQKNDYDKPVMVISINEILPEYQEEFHAAYGISISLYDKTASTLLTVKDLCPQLWHEIERVIIKKETNTNDNNSSSTKV